MRARFASHQASPPLRGSTSTQTRPPKLPVTIVHRRLEFSTQPFIEAGCGLDHSPEPTAAAKFIGDWPAIQGGGIKKVNGQQYGGFLVKFTDSEKKDLTGEWFDQETDFMLGVYPIKGIHALYDHGLDTSIGAIPIGDITDVQKKPDGLWSVLNFNFAENLKAYLTELAAPDKWKNEQMAKAQRYHAMLKEMLDNGELGWSSGAHPQSIRVAKSGHIDRWPIWEASATLQPAMPFDTTIQAVKAKPNDFFTFEKSDKPQNHAGVAG